VIEYFGWNSGIYTWRRRRYLSFDSESRVNDDQRRRLAAKAKDLGRKVLAEVATIVTPESLLAWHRKLIAPQVRWQWPARTRALSHAARSRKPGDSNGGREPGLGLSPHPGRIIQFGTRDCSQHNCRHSETARDRASTRTSSEDDLEGLSHSTLGNDCGRRFLHRGSVDPKRTAALHRSVLYRSVYAESGDCRHCLHSQWIVDEPGRRRG
jgi:hypothetical protein